MLNALRISKYLNTALAAKAVCYACQTRRSDKYLLTGIEIQGEGGLAFCDKCFSHMARKMGWLSPTRLEAINRNLTLAYDEAKELKENFVELKKEHDRLDEFYKMVVGKVNKGAA